MAWWVDEPSDSSRLLQNMAALNRVSQAHPRLCKDADAAARSASWSEGRWREDCLPPVPSGPVSRCGRLVLQEPGFLRKDHLRFRSEEAPLEGSPPRRVEGLNSEAKLLLCVPAAARAVTILIAWGGDVSEPVPMRRWVFDETAPASIGQHGLLSTAGVAVVWPWVTSLAHSAAQERRRDEQGRDVPSGASWHSTHRRCWTIADYNGAINQGLPPADTAPASVGSCENSGGTHATVLVTATECLASVGFIADANGSAVPILVGLARPGQPVASFEARGAKLERPDTASAMPPPLPCARDEQCGQCPAGGAFPRSPFSLRSDDDWGGPP